MKNLKTMTQLFESKGFDEKDLDKLRELTDEDFVTSLLGTSSLGKKFAEGDDFEIDQDSDKSGASAWIEINGFPQKAFDALDADYNKFAAPFEKWAKNNGFDEAEVTTRSHNPRKGITFLVKKSSFRR